jgi:acetylcholinesterase
MCAVVRKLGVLSVVVIVIAYFVGKYFFTYEPSPIVKIKNGKLQGLVSKSRDGREYFAYVGIPFAEPPVGSLRFEVN